MQELTNKSSTYSSITLFRYS